MAPEIEYLCEYLLGSHTSLDTPAGLTSHLNDMARQGWRLTAMCPAKDAYVLVLEREK